MRPDVIDLREFYGTRLGQVARKFVRYRIRQLWPDLSGLDLLALGYPTPYLRQFQGDSVVRWHPGRVIFQQRAVFIKQDA